MKYCKGYHSSKLFIYTKLEKEKIIISQSLFFEKSTILYKS